MSDTTRGMSSQDYGNRIVLYNDERFYYCGRWDGRYYYDAVIGRMAPNGNNGMTGDVRMRPVALGPGEFTFTGGPMAPRGDVTWERES